MDERWAPVLGAEGAYEVSSTGRVRSLDRIDNARRRLRGIELSTKARAGQRGYPVVKLCPIGGQRKMRYVHELVLEAFVSARPTGLYGLHRNDDPEDNRLENLYWGTQAQNMQDSTANGTHPNLRITTCKRGHELKAPNLLRSPGRRCLSCHYARSYATAKGIPFDPAIADARYESTRAADTLHVVRSLREVA